MVTKKLFFIGTMIVFFLLALPTSAEVVTDINKVYSGDIVKLDGNPALYLVEGNYTRRLFPNSSTFWSRYQGSWSDIKNDGVSVGIKTISSDVFSSLRVGDNVTVSSGNLIQLKGGSKVYFVFQNRKLKSFNESELNSLYGSDWKNYLIKIPIAFENDYQLANDEFIDLDNDGLLDIEEYYLYNTDPTKADTDGDGYNDGREVVTDYNPILDEKKVKKEGSDIYKINKLVAEIFQLNKTGEYDNLFYLTKDTQESLNKLSSLSNNTSTDDSSSESVGEFTFGDDDYFIKGIISNDIGYEVVINSNSIDKALFFVKEGVNWKMAISDSAVWDYILEKYEGEKEFAEKYYNQGNVDLVINDLKTIPENPKVNDFNSELYIYYSNMGTKPALDGISMKLERDSSYMPNHSNCATMSVVIWPGQTGNISTSLYDDFFIRHDLGELDEPGEKTFSVTIDDLNASLDDITTNNTFSKTFYFTN